MQQWGVEAVGTFPDREVAMLDVEVGQQREKLLRGASGGVENGNVEVVTHHSDVIVAVTIRERSRLPVLPTWAQYIVIEG